MKAVLENPRDLKKAHKERKLKTKRPMIREESPVPEKEGTSSRSVGFRGDRKKKTKGSTLAQRAGK